MTSWHTVYDSRPEKPEETDTTTSAYTVYLRKDIKQEERQDDYGGNYKVWVYQQMTLTREEYEDLNSPQTQAVMQAVNEQTANTIMAVMEDNTTANETIMQTINQQTADIMSVILTMGG